MKEINPEEIVFINIETVSGFPSYADMDLDWQELWVEKNKRQLNEYLDASECYQQRAGVMAEFGKIICICIGYFSCNGDVPLTTNLFLGSGFGRGMSWF